MRMEEGHAEPSQTADSNVGECAPLGEGEGLDVSSVSSGSEVELLVQNGCELTAAITKYRYAPKRSVILNYGGSSKLEELIAEVFHVEKQLNVRNGNGIETEYEALCRKLSQFGDLDEWRIQRQHEHEHSPAFSSVESLMKCLEDGEIEMLNSSSNMTENNPILDLTAEDLDRSFNELAVEEDLVDLDVVDSGSLLLTDLSSELEESGSSIASALDDSGAEKTNDDKGPSGTETVNPDISSCIGTGTVVLTPKERELFIKFGCKEFFLKVPFVPQNRIVCDLPSRQLRTREKITTSVQPISVVHQPTAIKVKATGKQETARRKRGRPPKVRSRSQEPGPSDLNNTTVINQNNDKVTDIQAQTTSDDPPVATVGPCQNPSKDIGDDSFVCENKTQVPSDAPPGDIVGPRRNSLQDQDIVNDSLVCKDKVTIPPIRKTRIKARKPTLEEIELAKSKAVSPDYLILQQLSEKARLISPPNQTKTDIIDNNTFRCERSSPSVTATANATVTSSAADISEEKEKDRDQHPSEPEENSNEGQTSADTAPRTLVMEAATSTPNPLISQSLEDELDEALALNNDDNNRKDGEEEAIEEELNRDFGSPDSTNNDAEPPKGNIDVEIMEVSVPVSDVGASDDEIDVVGTPATDNGESQVAKSPVRCDVEHEELAGEKKKMEIPEILAVGAGESKSGEPLVKKSRPGPKSKTKLVVQSDIAGDILNQTKQKQKPRPGPKSKTRPWELKEVVTEIEPAIASTSTSSKKRPLSPSSSLTGSSDDDDYVSLPEYAEGEGAPDKATTDTTDPPKPPSLKKLKKNPEPESQMKQAPPEPKYVLAEVNEDTDSSESTSSESDEDDDGEDNKKDLAVLNRKVVQPPKLKEQLKEMNSLWTKICKNQITKRNSDEMVALKKLLNRLKDYRKKFFQEIHYDVKNGILMFPPFKDYRLCQWEYCNLNWDKAKGKDEPNKGAERMKHLMSQLEEALENAPTIKQRPGQKRHPIWIQALDEFERRKKKDTEKGLKLNILGMVCLAFHLADNNAAEMFLIRRKGEEFNKSIISTPRIVAFEKELLSKSAKNMFIYVEGRRYIKVPNLYQGILTAYALHYLFNIEYSPRLRPLFTHFDKLAGTNG